MAEITIRPATRADIAGLEAMEALFPTDRMSRRSLLRFLRVPNAVLLVADDADAGIIGNLLILFRKGSDNARIYSLVVAPAARGRGIARRLVTAAEETARARHCRRVSLEVRVDNEPARALYQSMDYALLQPLPGFYEDGADALRLSRPLKG